jgi:hypothetical protein
MVTLIPCWPHTGDALPPNLLEIPTLQERQLSSLPPKFDDYRPPLLGQERPQPRRQEDREVVYAPPKLREYLPPLFGGESGSEHVQNTLTHLRNVERQPYSSQPGSEYVVSNSGCTEEETFLSTRCRDLVSTYPEAARTGPWSGDTYLSTTSYRRPSDDFVYSGQDFDYADQSLGYYSSTDLADRQPVQPEQDISQPIPGLSQETLTYGHPPYTERTIFREDLNYGKEDKWPERSSSPGLSTVPCLGASKFFLEECVLARSNNPASLAMDVP